MGSYKGHWKSRGRFTAKGVKGSKPEDISSDFSVSRLGRSSVL